MIRVGLCCQCAGTAERLDGFGQRSEAQIGQLCSLFAPGARVRPSPSTKIVFMPRRRPNSISAGESPIITLVAGGDLRKPRDRLLEESRQRLAAVAFARLVRADEECVDVRARAAELRC